jgi:AbrB family looped-hinge helix DNA binding protein
MAEGVVSAKYQIVIPREVREALGLKPGDKLVVVEMGKRIIIMEKQRSFRSPLVSVTRGLYPRKERDGRA